jgi:hypothetical protein
MDSQTKVDEVPVDEDSNLPSSSDQQSGVAPSESSVSQNGEPPPGQELARRQGPTLIAPRKRAGPRTQIGKANSKYNALKHGLFANVVLLSSEPRSEFNALLRGLDRDLAPEGVLEKILVEKLATLFWRYRRLLQAESAELRRSIQLERIEQLRRSERSSDFLVLLDAYLAQSDKEGLISKIGDPTVLALCLDRLRGVSMELKKFGLDHETHRITLGRIYGARYEGRPAQDLFDSYLSCFGASKALEVERQRKGFQSREDCLKRFLAETEKEICRLEALAKQFPSVAALAEEPIQLETRETVGSALFDAAEMERLTRYEASIERAIHRTLEQLERVQQLRCERALPCN